MRKYLVSGTAAYNGHEPGSVFNANLAPDAEARAIQRGSIERVAKDRKNHEGPVVKDDADRG